MNIFLVLYIVSEKTKRVYDTYLYQIIWDVSVRQHKQLDNLQQYVVNLNMYEQSMYMIKSHNYPTVIFID